MAALTLVLGPERAALFSPHSWRVWLASALRMAGAPDPLIQALGRWMNPESIKIYARLGTEEYKHWIDKMMTVTHIDAARTTNLPPLRAHAEEHPSFVAEPHLPQDSLRACESCAS